MPSTPKQMIGGWAMTACGGTALILVFLTFALSEKLMTLAWTGFAGLDDAVAGISAVLVCGVALGILTKGPGADELRRRVEVARGVRENASELANSVRNDVEVAAAKRGYLKYAVAVGAFYTFGQQILNAVYEIQGVPWFDRVGEIHGWAEHVDAWGLVIGIACGFVLAGIGARHLERLGSNRPAERDA